MKLAWEAADLPEWIRLLPVGKVDLVDGRPPVEVDRESLTALVAEFEARGVDLVVDYEHQSLQGGRAPAAGWIKELEARDDGLWARVEWTAQAQEYLRQKEYRYFSPVLRLDPETRRPLALMQVALTNVPAMKGVAPLVAKYGGEASALNGEVSATGGEDGRNLPVEERKGRPGPAPEASEKALWREARELFQELAAALGLAEGAGVAQVKDSLLALKAGAAQAEALKAELETLKARLAEEQTNRTVGEALKAGKISPAQKGWALDYCRRDPEGFRAFVAGAPQVVPVGVSLDLAPGAQTAKGQLTPEEMAVCRAANLSPEEYLKAKKEMHQRKKTEV